MVVGGLLVTMTIPRDVANSARVKAGRLSRDVDRLALRAGVSREVVYAFLCGGYVGPGSSSEWLDKEVSDDVKKHLRSL
jgi:hypothetical protein